MHIVAPGRPRLVLAALTALACAVFAPALHAQSAPPARAMPIDDTLPHGRPVQVAFTVGTTGLGLEVARLVTNRLGLRLGAAGAGLSIDDYDAGDLTVGGSVRLVSTHLVVDAYPFSHASFHLTGGVMSGRTSARANARPTNGTFDLNGVEYAAGRVGTLTGRVTVPNAMPYVGIGFGRPSRYGFRVIPVADIGVGIGHASVTLRAENAATDPQIARDVAAEQAKIQKDLDKVPVYPVIRTTIGWRF